MRCLQGFLHLEGVLDASEVAAANDAIDAHAAEFSTDTPVGTLSRDQPGLRGDSVRAVPTYRPEDGPLGWAEGERDPFRAMLVHERIIPALNGMLGKGFRMVSLPPPAALTRGAGPLTGGPVAGPQDHAPDVISAKPGAEGHRLHGGMIPFNPAGYYMFRSGSLPLP